MSNEKIKQVRTSRILKEFKEAYKNPYDSDNNIFKIDEGIFIHINEEDITHVKILIIGPSDTPYENGYYFFDYEYTNNYPFEAPKVLFRSTDGIIRFNPNLYANGKVCLSILGTWQGPPWEPCMSISDVCFYLRYILNNNPLENEPGFEKRKDNVMKNYILYVDINNYSYAINTLLRYKSHTNFSMFNITMYRQFLKNFLAIEKHVSEAADTEIQQKINYNKLHISPYNKYISTSYLNILKDLYINISIIYYINEIYKIFNEEEGKILKEIYSQKSEIIINNLKQNIYKKLINIIETNEFISGNTDVSENKGFLNYYDELIDLFVITSNKELFNKYIKNKIKHNSKFLKKEELEKIWNLKTQKIIEIKKNIDIKNLIEICKNYGNVKEQLKLKIVMSNDNIDIINFKNLLEILNNYLSNN